MRRALSCLLLTLTLSSPAAFAARAAQEMREPPPIPVSENISQDQARKAIHAAVEKHGWVIDRESPGHSEAAVVSGSHVVRVDIAYETRLIQINYLDSQEMSFERRHNVRYIHPKYMKWTRTLAEDIDEQIQLIAAAKPQAAKK
ncbi:MAG TPA: hypothetical protein VFB36_12630 [Nevskiaceae bacterium]|nr:hypothetical protein [Nevskiaceae bacterium]